MHFLDGIFSCFCTEKTRKKAVLTVLDTLDFIRNHFGKDEVRKSWIKIRSNIIFIIMIMCYFICEYRLPFYNMIVNCNNLNVKLTNNSSLIHFFISFFYFRIVLFHAITVMKIYGNYSKQNTENNSERKSPQFYFI